MAENNTLTLKIDAIYQSKGFQGMFTLEYENLETAKDAARELVSGMLSFPEKKFDKEGFNVLVQDQVILKTLNFNYGNKIYTTSRLDTGYGSDIGKGRELNEDSLVIITTEIFSESRKSRSALFIIGDGVGGHSKGEVASYLGTKTVACELIATMLSEKTESQIKSALIDSTKKANITILNYAQNPEYKGMATTLTVALLEGQYLYISNVGDSRAYIVNKSEIRQITKDHSIVQEMIDSGKITHDEARHHPQKNVVTRIVGYYADIDVDIFVEQIWKEDYIMLCCDGLTDAVKDEEIKEIILNSKKSQIACKELIKRANEIGGSDNISLIVSSSNDIPTKKNITKEQEKNGKNYKKLAVTALFLIILSSYLGALYYYPMISNEKLIDSFYKNMNSNDYSQLPSFTANNSNASEKIKTFVLFLDSLKANGSIELEDPPFRKSRIVDTTKSSVGYIITVNDNVRLFHNGTKIFDKSIDVEYYTKKIDDTNSSIIDKILLNDQSVSRWKIYDIKYNEIESGSYQQIKGIPTSFPY